MTCARCETVISRALNSLECVQSANVDFANNSAEVLLTHNIADAKYAVEGKGYGSNASSERYICDVIRILPKESSARNVTLNIGMSKRCQAVA